MCGRVLIPIGHVSVVRYFVHGAGRAGKEAWPAQDSPGAVFADHSAASGARDKEELVCRQCPDDVDLVVAHSLGAVPVALAYAAGRITAPLVLIEPALYDIARGDVAVEAHIGPMTQARARAATGDLFGYWQIVAPMMFGRDATHEGWPEDRAVAEKFAALEPPWGHGINASVFADVQVLVITGAWNAEYEAIAGRLVEVGARHVPLAGSGHRPQDHPEVEAVISSFAADQDKGSS